nr:glycosyltransferase [Chloroflexia bacterium]
AQGLAGARNCGVRAARGDIIAFLDDDAIAAADWLSRLSAGYDNPSVNGVGGAIEPLWSSGRPTWFPQEFDWVVGCTYRGLPETAAPVRNLIGANMSFRRKVFEIAGGFRSGIGRVGAQPSGCEETELCIRASQLVPGTVFMYEPSARVYHRVPSNRATWDYYRRRCHAEGRSKVLVATLVGAGDGLASERAYTFATLPQGVARGVGAALMGSGWAGFTRAGAIVAGLMITTAGYLTGHISAGSVFGSRTRPARAPTRWPGPRFEWPAGVPVSDIGVEAENPAYSRKQ